MNITEEQARAAAKRRGYPSHADVYIYEDAIQDCAKWMDHAPDCEKVVGHYVNVDIGQGGAYYTYDTCTCGLDEFLRAEQP